MDWQLVAFAAFMLVFVTGWVVVLMLFAVAIRRGYRFRR